MGLQNWERKERHISGFKAIIHNATLQHATGCNKARAVKHGYNATIVCAGTQP